MADSRENMTPEDLVKILNILPERQAKVDALLAHGAKEEKPKVKKEDKVKREDAVYCVCRQSSTDSFMIGCDKCDEWFHGKCIGIIQEEARMIKHFYCKPCLDANPELSIKYKKKKIKVEIQEVQGEQGDILSTPVPHENLLQEYFPEEISHKEKVYKEKVYKEKVYKEKVYKEKVYKEKVYKEKNHKEKNHKEKIHKDNFEREKYEKASAAAKSRKSRMCGECVACTRTTDCAVCDFCKDMRKFGGPNKMRQKCRLRQCLKMSRMLLRKTGDSRHAQHEESYIRRKYKEVALKEKRQKKAVKMKHATSSGRKEKVKPQLSDHYSRRRRRMGSDERKGGSDQPADKINDIPRHCYGPGCQHAARVGSKYCSDECGVQLAVRRIQEILPKRMKNWNREPCVADKRSQESLKEVSKKRQEAQNMLLELDKRSQALDCIIEKGNQHSAVPTESQEADMDTDTDLQIHCATCGLLLAPRVALRHMEKCYMKNESLTTFGSAYKSAGTLFCDVYNAQQRIYCKRLRVLCPEHTKEPKIPPTAVCGCPLVKNVFKETDKICLSPKRSCMKHYKWEKLRRAEIDLQRVQQWLKLEEAFEQERAINYTTAQRGGVLGMLLHQTISPDWEEEEKAEEAAKLAEAENTEEGDEDRLAMSEEDEDRLAMAGEDDSLAMAGEDDDSEIPRLSPAEDEDSEMENQGEGKELSKKQEHLSPNSAVLGQTLDDEDVFIGEREGGVVDT